MVKGENEVPAAIREIGLPAVVKPVESWLWGGSGQQGVRLICQLVTTPEEARRAVSELTCYGGRILFQQFLSGRREAVSFLYANGQIYARFAQWARRTQPPLGGTSVYRQSIVLPEDIGHQAEELVREIELEGYSEVEFRRDSAGKAYLMEINPRLSASVEVAVRAGVDFPYLLYQWANGEKIDRIESYQPGIWMRYLAGDIVTTVQALLQRGRPGVDPPARAVLDFCTAFFTPTGYDYLEWRDPLPALVATVGFVHHHVERFRPNLIRYRRRFRMNTFSAENKLGEKGEGHSQTFEDLYTKGGYLAKQPTWHVEESPWKVKAILRMLKQNHLQPTSICEVGCGAGEVIKLLQDSIEDDCIFWGYEISPQAFELCKSRANERLHFKLADFTQEKEAFYDLLLVLDVFEHIEDYFSFLRTLKPKGEYKIFQVPLDLSIRSILFKELVGFRRSFGHIHYFTKELAIQTLKDLGYEVLDYFYTMEETTYPPLESQASRLRRARRFLGRTKRRLLKPVDKFLLTFMPDIAERLFGRWRLLILVK